MLELWIALTTSAQRHRLRNPEHIRVPYLEDARNLRSAHWSALYMSLTRPCGEWHRCNGSYPLSAPPHACMVISSTARTTVDLFVAPTTALCFTSRTSGRRDIALAPSLSENSTRSDWPHQRDLVSGNAPCRFARRGMSDL